MSNSDLAWTAIGWALIGVGSGSVCLALGGWIVTGTLIYNIRARG